ncbi:MAG TPA: hypothetical protein VKA31_11410 [Mariprofundaceae bacterium]|nr:hypothetical protein [Mariprofundaceae bacterium]
MKVALEKSVKTHKEARKVYVEMEALFDRHDLAALAQAKPGLIELRVNRATAADGRLFECITDPDCTPTSGQPSSD